MASISVSANYYLRNMYGTNRTLITASKRAEEKVGTLNFADASALRNSIKKLADFKYSDTSKSSELNTSLKAFADTYNLTIDSGSKSTTKEVKSAAKNIKKLSEKYEKELKELGVTFDKKGNMKVSSTATTNISTEKFESMFGSKSDYMKQLANEAQKIKRKVDITI